MPWKPMPPCRHRGCPNLQERDGRGFCREHLDDGLRESRRGRFRDRKNARFYGRRYREARAFVLARRPLCDACLAEGLVTEAEETHHVIPVAAGGPSTVENLHPLCRRHHEELHLRARDGQVADMRTPYDGKARASDGRCLTSANPGIQNTHSNEGAERAS